ncbi:hypothetical protein ABPG75_003532 [Micractinium tetrahymenae]
MMTRLAVLLLLLSGALCSVAGAPPAAEKPAAAAAPEAQRPTAASTPTAPAPAAEAPRNASAAGGALTGGSCPDRQAILDAHNAERAQHGAAPLTWSADLADKAQAAAAKCQLQPSGSGYGENLAAGTAYSTCAAAVLLWLGGRSSYSAGSPPQSALSWTQVVWKASTQLGCGFAQCGGGLGGLVGGAVRVTLPGINRAIREGDHEELERLLSACTAAGVQPPVVPTKVPASAADALEEGDVMCFSYDGSENSDINGLAPWQDPLFTLLHASGDQDSPMHMAELLLQAGYWPTVYRSVEFEARENPPEGGFVDRLELKNFNILFDWERPEVQRFQRGVPNPVAAPQLDGPNRLLVMMIKGEPWTPEDTANYPPAFQAAIQMLLLAHCRGGPVRASTAAASAGGGSKGGGSAGSSGGDGKRKKSGPAAELEPSLLSLLPRECVMDVIRHLAAPPLSPWLFLEDWGTVEFPDIDAVLHQCWREEEEGAGDDYEDDYRYYGDPFLDDYDDSPKDEGL